MNRFLHYIYFYIFDSYYKDGNYKDDIPWYTALVLLTASLFTMMMNLWMLAQYTFELPVSLPNTIWAYLLPVLFLFVVCYVIIIRDKKYLKYYEENKNDKTMQEKIFVWFIVVMPFILVLIIPIL